MKHNAPAALLLSAILLLQGCAAAPAEKTAPTAAPEPAAEPEVSAELPESIPANFENSIGHEVKVEFMKVESIRADCGKLRFVVKD